MSKVNEIEDINKKGFKIGQVYLSGDLKIEIFNLLSQRIQFKYLSAGILNDEIYEEYGNIFQEYLDNGDIIKIGEENV